MSTDERERAEFCWLVELFLPDGGNSLGWYHTGFTDLSGDSRSTQDPYQAKRYSKAEAESVAKKLGFTLQGVWRAVEHGFALAATPTGPDYYGDNAGLGWPQQAAHSAHPRAKKAAEEIASLFKPGFFDDKMVEGVAAVIRKHYEE